MILAHHHNFQQLFLLVADTVDVILLLQFVMAVLVAALVVELEQGLETSQQQFHHKEIMEELLQPIAVLLYGLLEVAAVVLVQRGQTVLWMLAEEREETELTTQLLVQMLHMRGAVAALTVERLHLLHTRVESVESVAEEMVQEAAQALHRDP